MDQWNYKFSSKIACFCNFHSHLNYRIDTLSTILIDYWQWPEFFSIRGSQCIGSQYIFTYLPADGVSWSGVVNDHRVNAERDSVFIVEPRSVLVSSFQPFFEPLFTLLLLIEWVPFDLSPLNRANNPAI